MDLIYMPCLSSNRTATNEVALVMNDREIIRENLCCTYVCDGNFMDSYQPYGTCFRDIVSPA